MFFKRWDCLSPKITLYYNGSLAHKSVVSGILTLVYYIVLLIFIGLSLRDIVYKKNKSIFYYQNYIKEPETLHFNSSTLFHYLSLQGKDNEVRYDQKAINIFGVKAKENQVKLLEDRFSLDHWKYSFCNFDTDFSHDFQVTFDTQNPLCIQEFYNHTSKKSFHLNEEGFVYPTLQDGINEPDYIPYVIIINRCKNIPGDDQSCYSAEKIESYIETFSSIILDMIDYYTVSDDYKNPMVHFLHSTKVERLIYSIFSVNFRISPLFVNTQEGIIFDKTKSISKYTISDINQGSFNLDNSTMLGFIKFDMQNQACIYERKYTKITEIIASISGISKLASTVLYFINFLYNRYVMYYDFFNLMKVRHQRNYFLFNEKTKRDSCKHLNKLTENQKITIKKSPKLQSFFMQKKVEFLSVVRYYLKVGPTSQNMKILVKIREKLFSEERLIKLYLFSKKIKNVLIEEKKIFQQKTLINTLIEKDLVKMIGEQKKLNESSHDLVGSILKQSKLNCIP